MPGSSFHMKSVLPCGPGLAERWPVCVTRESGQNGYSDKKDILKVTGSVRFFFNSVSQAGSL